MKIRMYQKWCCLPTFSTASALRTKGQYFRGSIPSPHVPLSTLQICRYRHTHMTRGQRGWLILHCTTLAFATPCQLSGASERLLTLPSEQDAHEFYQTIKNTCLPGNSKTRSKENSSKFSEYADHYLSTYVKVVCKVHTWKHYKRIIEGYLIPAWTSKTLDQISRTDIKNIILNLQEKGLSPSTVGNIRAVISGIFSYACEEEYIAVNPASRLGKFIKKKDKRKN